MGDLFCDIMHVVHTSLLLDWTPHTRVAPLTFCYIHTPWRINIRSEGFTLEKNADALVDLFPELPDDMSVPAFYFWRYTELMLAM